MLNLFGLLQSCFASDDRVGRFAKSAFLSLNLGNFQLSFS